MTIHDVAILRVDYQQSKLVAYKRPSEDGAKKRESTQNNETEDFEFEF